MKDSIPSIRISDLHNKLGFKNFIECAESSLSKHLAKWKMEIDDAPIFRYIYRNFRPERHLEFGTWQGQGVLYCLEECNATVWTINRPFGEDRVDGENAYGHDNDELPTIKKWALKIGMPPKEYAYRTDTIGFIGRFYLEKNLGARVCQIYCDSREWDNSNYPSDFFDTVLIDGGHQEEIVISDTRKALEVLRPGGIIMWHDFCPDEDVMSKCATPESVVTAIRKNIDWIGEEMKDLFWITPSWILLGIRK
ncbi:MAG: class I SAM-dependent methyltransferase [Planctomycetota bacterium]